MTLLLSLFHFGHCVLFSGFQFVLFVFSRDHCVFPLCFFSSQSCHTHSPGVSTSSSVPVYLFCLSVAPQWSIMCFSHHVWFLVLCGRSEFAAISCQPVYFVIALKIFFGVYCGSLFSWVQNLQKPWGFVFLDWDLSWIVLQSNLVFPFIILWSCCGIDISQCWVISLLGLFAGICFRNVKAVRVVQTRNNQKMKWSELFFRNNIYFFWSKKVSKTFTRLVSWEQIHIFSNDLANKPGEMWHMKNFLDICCSWTWILD